MNLFKYLTPGLRVLLVMAACMLSLLVLTTACKTSSKAEKQASKDAAASGQLDPKSKLIREAFLDGKKYRVLENPEKAIERFLEVLRLDSRNAAAMYELSMLYHEQFKISDALSMAAKAVDVEPNNKWFLFLYAQLLEQTQQYKEAAEQYKALIALDPHSQTFYEDLAQNYLFSGKYNEALKVYNDIEKRFGLDEGIVMQKQKIYLSQGKNDKAAEEILKLIKQYPKETRYYSILAETYMTLDMRAKALECYQKILELDPADPYIHVALSEYYRKAGDTANSFKELKLAFANPNLEIDLKIQVLLTYLSMSDFVAEIKEQSYALLDILVATHPKEAKAHSVLGDFLFHDQRLEEARDAFRQVIRIDSSRYAVWEQLIRIEAELEDYQALASEGQRAMGLFPEQPVPYLFAGMALYQLKQYEASARALKQGAFIVVDNDELEHTFYSMLGDTWNQLKEYGKSDTAYDKSLKIKPDNAYVLNNYSYFLSLRGENLEKAEKMAAKANELSPDNPSYLDTHAWAFYKLNKFQEALALIRQAVEKGGQANAVILEHYGDILYKLGEQNKAIEYWQKAKEAGTASEFLDKKLKDKMLHE